MLDSDPAFFDDLERATAALDAGEPARARTLAEPSSTADDPDVRHDAWTVIAHAWFDDREFSRAAEVFARLAGERGFAVDWFQLATTSALAGDLAQARDAFARCIALTDAADEQPTLPDVSLLYRWFAIALKDGGHADAALDPVADLVFWHASHAATEDTACQRLGLPTFTTTLQLAEDVLRACDRGLDARAWAAHVADSLEDRRAARELIAVGERVGHAS